MNLLSHTEPRWKFWDPGSGLVGGMICGAIIILVVQLLSWVISPA